MLTDKEKDNCYPTMGYTIKVRMAERPTGGWRWYTEAHVQGPDTVLRNESTFFETKKECLMDMNKNFLKNAETLLSDCC